MKYINVLCILLTIIASNVSISNFSKCIPSKNTECIKCNILAKGIDYKEQSKDSINTLIFDIGNHSSLITINCSFTHPLNVTMTFENGVPEYRNISFEIQSQVSSQSYFNLSDNTYSIQIASMQIQNATTLTVYSGKKASLQFQDSISFVLLPNAKRKSFWMLDTDVIYATNEKVIIPCLKYLNTPEVGIFRKEGANMNRIVDNIIYNPLKGYELNREAMNDYIGEYICGVWNYLDSNSSTNFYIKESLRTCEDDAAEDFQFAPVGSTTIECITEKNTKLTVGSIPCWNSYQCRILSQCIDLNSAPQQNENSRGDIAKNNRKPPSRKCGIEVFPGTYCPRNCQYIKHQLSPIDKGIAKCYNSQGKSRSLIYFVGFDGRIYTNDTSGKWLEILHVPVEAILKVESQNNQLYISSDVQFTCEAHSFFAGGPLQWFLSDRNGSEFEIPKDLIRRKTEEKDSITQNRISNIILTFPSSEIYRIFCATTLSNSSDEQKWMKLAFDLRFENSVTPKIKSTDAFSRENLSALQLLAWSAITILVIITGMFVAYLKCRRNKRNIFDYITDEEVNNFINGSSKRTDVNIGQEQHDAFCQPYNSAYELKKGDILIDKNTLLGFGTTGIVYLGSVKKDGHNKCVAIKTAKDSGDKLRSMLSELKIMIYLGQHQNVIGLIGAYTMEIKNGIIYIATEVCAWGSLHSYLTANKDNFLNKSDRYKNVTSYVDIESRQTAKTYYMKLLRWASEIANGMQYLGLKHVVHSDLAARNVLLTFDEVTKITDFGLSRRMHNYSDYVKSGSDPLPWKWMAPESLLTNTFAVHSDVWSYGITIWEIFSLSGVPFPGTSYTTEFPLLLQNGLQNVKPKLANSEIYKVMQSCWNLTPTERPPFSALRIFFLDITRLWENKNTIQDIMDEDWVENYMEV